MEPGIREREKAIGHGAAVGARIPGLQERAGGGEQEIRESDGGGEEAENAEEGVVAAGGLPADGGNDGEDGETDQEQADVEEDLAFHGLLIQPVGPGVAAEEGELEEEHATGPDGRGATEPGED